MATLGFSDVHFYNSWMPDAPQLTGALGSVPAVIKACLVTGFGEQDPQGGWAVPYEDSNRMVFQSTHPNSTGMFFWVDDSSNYSVFYVRGFQDIQGASGEGGVAPFPDYTAQQCYKINSGSGSRRWTLFADSCAVYLFIDSDLNNPNAYNGEFNGGCFFGDYVSYTPGDALNALIIGGNPYCLSRLNSTLYSACAGTPRLGVGATYSFRVSWGNQGYIGYGSQPYPAFSDFGFHLWPVEVWGDRGDFKDALGVMPGLYSPTHWWGVSSGITYGDHFDANGNQYRTQISGGARYKCTLNLTGPWR